MSEATTMPEAPSRASLAAIAMATARVCRVNLGDMLGPCRPDDVVDARAVFAAYCRRYTIHSLVQIGRAISRKHSTVHHLVKRRYPRIEGSEATMEAIRRTLTCDC